MMGMVFQNLCKLKYSRQGPCQESNTATALEGQEDQLISCHLSEQDPYVCVNLCHDPTEQVQQQAAQTRYFKWLTTVGIVEDASEQLKVRNHKPRTRSQISQLCSSAN